MHVSIANQVSINYILLIKCQKFRKVCIAYKASLAYNTISYSVLSCSLVVLAAWARVKAM